MSNKVILINFGHPVTGEQRGDLEGLLGAEVKVLDAKVQIDMNLPFSEQADDILSKIDVAWQTEQILVSPCGFAPMWGVLLAKMNGKMGYFPTSIRVKSDDSYSVRKFVIGEIMPLQKMRDEARKTR